MPRQTNVYKLDRRDVQDQVALAVVLGDKEKETLIRDFCGFFSIPLDENAIQVKVADLCMLRDLILAQSKKPNKK